MRAGVVSTRLARLLGCGALLLPVLIGYRAVSVVHGLRVGDAIEVEGSLLGGLHLRWEEDGISVSGRAGHLLLGPGEEGALGPLRLGSVPAEGPWVEVLRRPWATYAGPRGGHRRLDFGADTTGQADGTRDLVILPGPGTTGFRLEATVPGSPFRPEDRAGVLTILGDGFTVDGGPVTRGGSQPVQGGFTVRDGAGLALRFRWQEGVRTVPVLGPDGRVVAYRGEPACEIVVHTHEGPTDTAPSLWIRAVGGPQEGTLIPRPGRGQAWAAGSDDLLTPWGRGALPTRVTDTRLVGAMDAALQDGRVGIEESGPRLHSAGGEPREVARQMAAALRTWDRGRRPLGLRFPGGRAPAGLEGRLPGQAWVPLRWDPLPGAWVLGQPATGAQRVELRLRPSPTARRVAIPRPASLVLPDGRESPLPWSGPWGEVDLPPSTTETVLALDLRVDQPIPVTLSIAGGPAGSRIDTAAAGPRTFSGWTEPGPGVDGVAARVLGELDGGPHRRWSADERCSIAAGAACFLRVVLSSREGGAVALDLTLPGRIEEVLWAGSPLPPARIRTQRDGVRLSLAVGAGAGVLAVRTAAKQVPLADGGGITFDLDGEGTPVSMAAHSVQRAARPPVRGVPARMEAWTDPTAFVLVEAGTSLLPTGTILRPGGAGDGTITVIEVPGEGPLGNSGAFTLSWDGGPRVASRHGDLRPVQRERAAPSLPPNVLGTRFPEDPVPVQDDGEGAIGPGLHLVRRPTRTIVATRLVLSEGGSVVLLDEETGADWTWQDRVVALEVDRAGDELRVRPGRASRLVQSDGTQAALRLGSWAEWPPGARMLTDDGLRLLRPERGSVDHVPAPPPWWTGGGSTTLVAGLQEESDAALDEQLLRARSGGEDAFSGAVLLMNSRDGAILACSSRGEEANLCWNDRGYHPGSTWKILTALAALDSTDPTLQAMVRGELPVGLLRAEGGSTLVGAMLPDLSGRWIPLRTRLGNHHGARMGSSMTLQEAMRGSTNTWFGYAGLLLDHPLRAGYGDAAIGSREAREEARPLLALARRAGWDRPVHLGAGVFGQMGSVPDGAPDSDAVITNRAIGQAEVTATPLGLATVVAAVLRGGEAPVPHLRGPSSPGELLASAAASRSVVAALKDVVCVGTAARAFADHPARTRILGKTGSAQGVDPRGLSRTDGWFAGAVTGEAGAPGVVIVVLMPSSGLGGRHAAEVADRVSRSVIRWQEGQVGGQWVAGR